MKQIFIFIILLFTSQLFAQNVGVNIASPEYTLDVRSLSTGEAGQLNVSNSDKSRFIRFFTGSDLYPDPSTTWKPGHNFLFATYDDLTFDFTEYMRIDSVGDVGIGIFNPEARLDVKGGDWNLDAGNPGDLRIGNSDHNLRIGVATGGGGAGITRMYSSNNLLFGVDDEPIMTMTGAGDVGIGKTNPEAKLDIKGGDWNLGAGNPGDLRIGDTTNNLRISVSTGGGGAGTSRLFSTKKLVLGLNNEPVIQVNEGGKTGFGTTNPSQKVHINGKLKVGDDANAPSEGTIRYNSTNNSFEGYDGTKWINLGGSSPYGSQGTFNLPNSSFTPSVSGNPTSFRAAQDLVLIKSSEEIQAWDDNTPPNPITKVVIYVDLFKKNASTGWNNVLSLSEEGPLFGHTYAADIALSENRVLIGHPSEKEVKEYSYFSGGYWAFSNKFDSPNSSFNDYFGSSVAIYEEMTIIGAPAVGLFDGPHGPGKAYVYDENDDLEGTLGGPGAELGDKFGADVDITLNRAIVGAPGNDFGSTSNAGSATVFNRLNGNWSANSTWYDDTLEEDENYGAKVAIEDADYFYIVENNGVDAYLVEGGYWVLKETISGDGGGYNATGFDELGSDKIIYKNASSEEDEITYIAAAERDDNNLFVKTSSLINGDSAVKGFQIVSDGIYTFGSNDKVYFFEY